MFEARAFAEAISVQLARGSIGPFVDCRHLGWAITVRRCVRMVEDPNEWTKPEFTGGLLLIGEVDDPACVLYPDERRRLVRIRPGWSVENLARSLANMHDFLQAALKLLEARLALARARRDATGVVLPASAVEATT